MAKKPKQSKKKVVRCKRTIAMVPPPCEREVGISAARVTQRLQQAKDWRAAQAMAREERKRREKELKKLQIKLF